MKKYFLILLTLCFTFSFSQSNTEIFLFDLETNSSKIKLKNTKNISNSPDYDNQPSFLSDSNIVYASTRNDQTDIMQYFANPGSKMWINYTDGGEYSPLKIPNKKEVSAVRLDPDGKQRLYAYRISDGKSTEIIKDLVVAYYTWYDKDNIVSAVIEGDDLNLYVSDLKAGKNRKYDTKVGRSFHKIPNSNLVSFISKKNKKQWKIKSLDPITGEIKVLANTIVGVEDICWINERTILSGKDSRLYKLTLNRDNSWKKVIDLSSQGISKITRLAVNSSSSKLLIACDVVEPTASSVKTPEEISIVEMNVKTERENMENTVRLSLLIQKQLDAYNAKDLEAFMAMYTEGVQLYNYPNELLSEGKDQMRKDYVTWFEHAPDLKATVKKRIVIGNKVIDEEQIMANGKIFNTVAIYEIQNGRIGKVTFIQ